MTSWSGRDASTWNQAALDFVHSAPVLDAALQMEGGSPLPQSIQRRAHELGFTTARLPADRGGYGMAMVDYVGLLERIGQGPGALRVFIHGQNTKWEMFERFGSTAQKRRYLPTFERGEWAASFALTEPFAGTGNDIATRATPTGSGWVLNGEKHLITHAASAQVLIVLAQHEDYGVSAFLVAPDTPGVSVTPMPELMGTRGIELAAVRFDDCAVETEALLGVAGQGLEIGLSFLDITRTALASSAVGLAQRALDLAAGHAATRVTSGKPIARRQAVQIKLADMEMTIRAGRALVSDAANAIDEGLSARHEASIAKRYTARMVTDVTDAAMQVLGGIGYTAQSPIERISRDARSFWFEEGTDDAQAFVIARTVIGSLTSPST